MDDSRTEQQTFAGRYVLVGLLGSGSFAGVWRALDLLLGREVALKVLHPQLAANDEDRQRFLAEARVLASLHHPNIVTVYDVGEADGRPFFTMELIQGRTLARIIAVRGRLALDEALRILAPLAAAVDCLHAAGLVHRDIKAANVMVETAEPAGRVVLMDFGIVLVAGSPRLTQAGFGMGTAESAAPEQIDGEVVGPAADIYALGVLAYEILAGRPPFAGDASHVLYAQANLPPPPLRLLCPGLSDTAYTAVDSALSKDPLQRPASAETFVTMLAQRGGSEVAVPSMTGTEPPVPAVAPRLVEGVGDSSVPGLELQRGLAAFHCGYVPAGPRGARFAVELQDEDGVALAVLVDVKGQYHGTRLWSVPAAGRHTLLVRTDGTWRVEIDQPDLAAQAGVTSAVGEGDGGVYLRIERGVRRLRINHRVWGGGLFRVRLLDGPETLPELLVATTGPYLGTVERRFDRGGTYVLAHRSRGALDGLRRLKVYVGCGVRSAGGRGVHSSGLLPPGGSHDRGYWRVPALLRRRPPTRPAGHRHAAARR